MDPNAIYTPDEAEDVLGIAASTIRSRVKGVSPWRATGRMLLDWIESQGREGEKS